MSWWRSPVALLALLLAVAASAAHAQQLSDALDDFDSDAVDPTTDVDRPRKKSE